MLAQAVQVGVLWKRGAQSEILRLEDDACSGSIEENLTRRCTGDGKRERMRRIVELDVGVLRLHALGGRGAREHGLRDLVNLVAEILDLDVNSIIYSLFRAN